MKKLQKSNSCHAEQKSHNAELDSASLIKLNNTPKNTTIVVATHKEYPFLKTLDEMYVPVHAGKAISKTEISNLIGDNTGDNISAKNQNYCELSVLYWTWKNIKSDYIGLCHYRRYFKKNGRVLFKNDAQKLLEEESIILPKKRNYFIETSYSQYIHAHHEQDLIETLKIITKDYPDYLDSWNVIMNSTKGHRFNMFIMRYDIFNDYCTWLFDILFKLEAVLDITNYSQNDKRVFGFVGERLLDVWLLKNNIQYAELNVLETEKPNWIVKGFRFLLRKFFA